MANLQAATLTIPTNVEGTVTPVTYDLKDATARAGAVELVKDTAGWTGKNEYNTLAMNYVGAGVTVTKNNDASLSLSGTTTGEFLFPQVSIPSEKHLDKLGEILPNTKYTFSIGDTGYADIRLNVYVKETSSSSWTNLVDEGDVKSVEFTTPSQIYDLWVRINIYANKTIPAVTLYPMLTETAIYKLSPSYEPYHDTVEAELAKKANTEDVAAIAAVIPSSATSSNKVATAEDVTATVDLMKDTTGWTGKSKVPNTASTPVQAINNVTITVNADKSVTLDSNGQQASADVNFTLFNWFTGRFKEGVKYRLSDVNGSANCYTYMPKKKGSSGSPVYNIDTSGTIEGREYFTYNSNEYDYYALGVYVRRGSVVDNVTLYPMVSEADVYDLSPAYEPYHESVEDWYWSENAKTGAHNFLNTEKFETGAKDGVTATLRADKGISLTGAPTLQSGTIAFRNYGTVLKAGTYKYKLNKKPKGTCVVGVNDSLSGIGNYKVLGEIRTNMTEISFTVTDEDLASKPYVFCDLGVHSSAGTIDEVYYPQILLNEDTFDGFMPFAMTNRELTEKVGNSGTYDLYMIANALTPANGAQPEFFIPWNNPELKTPTFSFTIRIRNNSAWETLIQSGDINIQKVCKNGFLVNASLTNALTSNSQYTFRIDGTITFS